MTARICYLILFFLFISENITAQGWVWGKAIDEDYTSFRYIDSDPMGNVYVASAGGSWDGIVKFDFDGNLIYRKVFNGNGVRFNSIASDSKGNLIAHCFLYSGICPPFDSLWIQVDSFYQSTLSCGPGFIIKLDEFGNVLWAKNLPQSLNANFLRVDSDDNIYLWGSADTITFDNITLSSPYPGHRLYYLAKLNNQGAVVWAKELINSSNRNNITQLLHIANNDEIIVEGTFKDSLSFLGAGLTASDSSNNFLAKVDPNGNLIWLKTIAGAIGNRLTPNSIGTDLNNNIYLSAYFTDTVVIDTFVFTTTMSFYYFWVRFDNMGNFKRANQFYAGGSSDFHTGIDGSIYVAGRTNPSLILNGTTYTPSGTSTFIGKLDSNFNTQWVFEQPEFVDASFATDNHDNAYVTSTFINIVYLGRDTLRDPGGLPAGTGVVAKYGYATPHQVVTGTAFFDSNSNCHFDNSEYAVDSVYVKATPGNYVAATDLFGNFSLALPYGTYQLQTVSPQGRFSPSCPLANNYTIVVDSTTTSLNFNFAYQEYAVSGTVYADANHNCSPEATEQKVANALIEVSPGPVYGTTNQDGEFYVNVNPGTYTVSEISKPGFYWQINCPSNPGNYNVTVSTPNNFIDGLDFGNNIIQGVEDLQVTLSFTGRFNPSRTVKFFLTYKNAGTVAMDGYVMLRYDSVLVYQLASQLYDQHNNHELRWNFTGLQVGESRTITANFGTMPPPSTWVGRITKTIATAFPVASDTTPSNNADTLQGVISISYDPNMKEVTPAGDSTGAIDISTDKLVYTVHFQNTGNDTAYNIFIKDTIQQNLDVRTFEMLAASHEYTYEISGPGIITWYFKNILLPDSNVNELASHGFVKYSISPGSSLPEGTQLKNSASIYFDFNEPIRTNESAITLKTPLTNISELNSRLELISIYPNPSGGEFTIEYFLSENTPVQIDLINVLGVRIKTISNHDEIKGEHQLNFSIDEPGIYFLKVNAGGEEEVRKILKVD